MIVTDLITPGATAERQVVVTDDVADDWAQSLGANSLRDLDEISTRTLYCAISGLLQSQKHPVKTRFRNEAGEIELDPDDLGAELFEAMRPEPINEVALDPTYSKVGFTISVMGRAASKAYREFLENPSETETTKLESIAAGARVALYTVLQPPNLAQ